MDKKINRSSSILRLRSIIFLLVLIAIIGGGIIAVKKKKNQLEKIPPPTLLPLPVNVVSVEHGEQNETRRYVGTIQAMRTVLVSPRTTGEVLDVNAVEGDAVKKGQTLVILDSRIQRAKIGALKSQLKAAKSSMITLRGIYERDQELFNGKALSREDLDKSRTAYETAQAKVAEILSNLKSADAELSYTRITAPVDGLVIGRLMEPGDMAQPGKPVLELEAVKDGYKIVVRVPQDIFSGLTKKTGVYVLPPITIQSPPLKLNISRLYPAPPSWRAAMPICEIVVNKRPFGLPSGSTVNVLFHLRKARGWVVPARSLLEQAVGNSTIYMVNEENRIHVVPVRVLLRNEDFICVEGQLIPKTQVVVAGEDVLIRLHEGDRVYPVKAEPKRRL